MIPKNSFVLALKPGEKVPDPVKNPRGTKDAQLAKPNGRPSGNYGIRLDGQYIAVDIDCDNPDREAFEASLPPTWSQRTARKDVVGMHYLYRVPEGYIGSGKKVWLGQDGNRIADIKAKGYIVGPGSVVGGSCYTMVSSIDPVDAPEWLLDFCRTDTIETSARTCSSEGIPNGEHNSFLANLTFWASQNWGLSEEANLELLRKGPLAVLQDIDSSKPWLDKDLELIARSGAAKGTNKPLELIEEDETGWKSITDTRMPLVKWHIQNFIPKGELVLQYGAGGIGKSTWISYLAAMAIKRGLTFGVASFEEPAKRFAVRTHLSDKTLSKEQLSNIKDLETEWRFPRDGDKLRKKLETCPLDILYFDSIYSHFEMNEGFSNTAEKARACLSPLASIAQELGITIIGTFHEGKNKDYLGSTEMLNVARVVLHATRRGKGPLKLQVKKTNFNQPDYALSMVGGIEGAESVEGDPWLEETEDGIVSQTQLYIVSSMERGIAEDETEFDLPQEDSKAVRDTKVMELISNGTSYREISKELGISLDTVSRIKNK